ncbi:kelch-like protein 40 [Elysia marginata]|uniref:Kelch-like protein 40 n=1 Tax=Elysia marginata TaxID=1093978 RepID=A0AAV4HBT6_9GAST|nr:kelch-like protein 40 [Elysia marginata]
MKEAREGKITLHGVDEGLFSTLLDFTYCGRYILTEENLFEIWAVADMLQIRVLISQCKSMWKKLCDNKLSTENAVYYLSKVRAVGKEPKQQVLDFICDRFLSMNININGTLEENEIQFLVNNNKLRISSEDQVIGSLLSWAEKISESNSFEPHKEETESGGENQIDSVSDNNQSITQHLANLLDRTRYLLISENCLHGTLAPHPLVKKQPECEAMVKKIVWYQSQAHLHQSWCPPAAVQREHSDMTNVLVLCKVDEQCRLAVLNLAEMKWKHVNLPNSYGCRVLCCDSRIYALRDMHTISLYLPPLREWRDANLDWEERFVRIVGKMIYLCKFENQNDRLVVTQVSNFSMLHHTSNQSTYSTSNITDSRLKGMTIKEVTSVGNTLLVFFGRGDLDSYSIVCFDKDRMWINVLSNQLASKSQFVTFAHDNEVFVLQENGCLWRIRQSSTRLDQITLTHELVLWDEETSLLGAALYNDQLLVVGEFSDQTGGFEILDRSLDGIFKSVRKVKVSQKLDNRCPRTSLAVLPKFMLC